MPHVYRTYDAFVYRSDVHVETDTGREPEPRRFHFRGERVKAFTIDVASDVAAVSAYGRYTVPRRFRVHLNDERYPVTLGVEIKEGRAECVSVSSLNPVDWISRSDPDAGRPKPDGLPRPIRGTLFRSLALARVLREVTAAIAGERRPLTIEEAERLALIDPGLASHDGEFIVPLMLRGRPGLEEFDAAVGATPRRMPKRGQRITDEECAQAATIYRKAIDERRATGAAVAEEFNLSLSSARRRISIARKRGFLGPANPRRAGERSDP
jgi:hypothetical protein